MSLLEQASWPAGGTRLNAISTNGWNEYRRRVLFELGEHDKKLEKYEVRIRELEKQLAILITKVTLFVTQHTLNTPVKRSIIVQRY